MRRRSCRVARVFLCLCFCIKSVYTESTAHAHQHRQTGTGTQKLNLPFLLNSFMLEWLWDFKICIKQITHVTRKENVYNEQLNNTCKIKKLIMNSPKSKRSREKTKENN